MQLTQPIDPEELADLGRRFGAMSYQHEVLAVTDPFLTEDHQRLLSDGRRAEICYIMHRGVPADGILLHHKIFYPGPAFRLPTGGVDPGEAVWDTLVREIYEETGLTVKTGEDGPGEVVVEDFLGVVSYDFHHRRLDQHFCLCHLSFFGPSTGRGRAPSAGRDGEGGWVALAARRGSTRPSHHPGQPGHHRARLGRLGPLPVAEPPLRGGSAGGRIKKIEHRLNGSNGLKTDLFLIFKKDPF